MELTTEDLVAALEDYRSPSEIGRHELSNEQWLLVRSLFPRPESRRGLPRHPRRLLDGMFWLLRTGAPWRDLPECVGEGRLDLLVGDRLVVELKAVRDVTPIHKAIVVSYLKATQRRLALLINFKVTRLKDGVQRVVLS